MITKAPSPEVGSRSVPPLSPIAIIGLSGILPESENVDQFWQNIIEEVNCIKEVPPSRWSIEDHYDPDPATPDKSYSKYGGFIPDIQFDPMEFGLPPNILEVTDVSQLLSLIVAKNALRDAGYLDSSEVILDHTGVILGMVGMSSKVIQPLLNRLQYPVWEKVLRSSSLPESEIPSVIEKMKSAYIQWNENAFPGAIGNVVAGRIANRLDLGGVNCIVDAACASSLAAISMAISELALGKADMMITGGVDTDNSILTYLCFSKTPAFSKGGHLRAFSAESDGMLTGEGIGMLVLKRLEDAERDNDRIYAVIRGVGASSDGHFKSIYAPRSSGQAKAIKRAYQQANYDPSTVRLIEAHGTGTNAGDPAEFSGLTDAFSDKETSSQVIALGSIKSQIGHTKATAGAASLIKTALALHQKVLPATINVSKPHPAMEIESTPFYLNTETRPWFSDPTGIPRRAGVSSFGFGGTNFHITLEEYPESEADQFRRARVPYSIVLSANDPAGLLDVCHSTVANLKGADSQTAIQKLDADSSASEIPLQNSRIGFVAENIDDALQKLDKCVQMLSQSDIPLSWSHPQGIYFRKSGMETDGKIVALFPGQGSQYINMGKELVINFPELRVAFEKTNTIFSQNNNRSLTDIVYPIPAFSDQDRKAQSQHLTRTENAQPAIGTFCLALYQLMANAGLQAHHFAGHSFGELTALWASGVYDRNAFIRLAVARGSAMSTAPSSDSDSGSMVAVKGDVKELQALLSGQDAVTIANFNSPTQVVLAGATDAVASMAKKLETAGFSVYPLSVSAAFHTPFVAHAQSPFKAAIQRETFQKPTKPVYSNSTAKMHGQDPAQITKNLEDHILNSVRFKEEIEAIYENGGRFFIEIGPKKILTNLVKDILKDQPHETITINPNPKGDSDLQLRQAVMHMRVLGIQISDVDPHCRRIVQEPVKPSKVAVTLNGGLYTTKNTRDAFKQALAVAPYTSPKDNGSRPNAVQQVASSTPQINDQLISSFGSVPQEDNALSSPVDPLSRPALDIDTILSAYQEHQEKILEAHKIFLDNDNLSKKTIRDITAAELALLSNNSGSPSEDRERQLSLLEKRLEFINKQQSGVSQAHQDYIKSQSEFTRQYIALISQLSGIVGSVAPVRDYEPAEIPTHSAESLHTTKDKPQPAQAQEEYFAEQPGAAIDTQSPSSVTENNYNIDELAGSFLNIVSEKTGYPTDMLELEMDMEADLGIDSIKRVEILGAMQEQYPDLPAIPAEDLVLLRTLQQIIDAFGSTTAIEQHQQSAPVAQMEAPGVEKADKVDENPPANADLQKTFIAIVSDKTGYPDDMLELEMDMEADLGIDSIKRVEILGTMQEQFPNLPTIAAEELVELRTLQQIINRFTDAGAPTASAAIEEPSSIVPAAVIENENAAIERRTVVVKPLPRPDYISVGMQQNDLILITDDRSERSKKLVKLFIEQQKNVGMIHFTNAPEKPENSNRNRLSHYYISQPDEAEVQVCMQAIANEHANISTFIHLNPVSNGNKKKLLAVEAKSEKFLKSVFLIARHLGKPLTAAAENGRSCFLTVTFIDGQLGLDGLTSNDPFPGGFSGLAKSLSLEWPLVFCRAVDIHPEIDAETVVRIIDAEMHDPNVHLTEVGYTSDGRCTLFTI